MSISNTVYLVVPAKHGWAVNNGADTLSVHPDHAAATRRAQEMSREAALHGEAADIVNTAYAKSETGHFKPL